MKETIIEFLVVYAFVLALYFFFFVFRRSKYDRGKMPIELHYLTSVYKIKKKDINYKHFLYIVSVVNSFIIAFTYIVMIKLVKGMLWQFAIGTLIIILLIIICYGIIGYWYKKRE